MEGRKPYHVIYLLDSVHTDTRLSKAKYSVEDHLHHAQSVAMGTGGTSTLIGR